MGILDIFGGVPSQARFARRMMAYLKSNGHKAPVRYVARDFQLKTGAHTFNLHNAYVDYCKAPRAGRDGVLAAYAQTLAMPGMPDTFAAARARLMPSIRARSTFSNLARLERANGVAGSALYRPLSGDAVVALAYDGEHTMQLVPAATLEQWGVSFEGAFAAALDNLRDATVPKFRRVAPGVVAGDWNDSYDSARMLLPELLHQLDLGASPAFMIPTRNRLLVASGNDAAALGKLIDLAHHVFEEEGRPVSARLYRLKEREAAEFVPEDADLADNLKLLQLKFLAADYATQKADLENAQRAQGRGLVVAPFTAYKIKGRLTSVTTLAKGVDTLLPKTDMITFVTHPEGGGEPRTRLVRWDVACAMLGTGMRPEDEYPPLYRVDTFPPEDVLERLFAPRAVPA